MKLNYFLTSLSVIFASIFFVINDAIINYLSSQNIMFYHFIFYGIPAYLSVPIYFLFTGKLKNHLKCSNYSIPLIRGLFFAPLPFITFVALKNITLPEYTTLNMVAPMFAAIIAFFYLKEKLNIYVYLSLFFGFVGVLFVVQPGFDNFNIYFLLTLLGCSLITLTTTIVNKYHYVTSNVGFFIYGGLFAHLISLFLFIYDPLVLKYYDLLFVIIASILINMAIFLMTYAFQSAQKFYASIFCLVYLQIFWSSIIGYFIFGEYLNIFAFIGAILIVISGIISIPGQIKQTKNIVN